MATTPKSGDPESKVKPKPAVPVAVKTPAPTKPVTVNDAPQTAINFGGANIGTYQDPANYPGLLKGESKGAYVSWLNGLAAKSPDYWALIQAHGPKMQTLLWRAYQDNQDPNLTLNEMTRQFGTSVFDAAGGGSAGGGGRGGGGSGGGGGAPTPQQIDAAKAAVRNRAGELGRPLSDDEITVVATTVVRDGWNSAQLDDWLLADPAKVSDPGLVTASVDQIRQMAANQLLTVSDATAKGWAQRINSGEMTTDAVQSIFQQQALGEFGWAADSIKAGINMKDMLAPARDQIAKELELTPEAVNLMDPKWRSMVTATDPKTGATRAATLTEVTRSARKAPEWKQTNSAHAGAANAFMMVRQMFEG